MENFFGFMCLWELDVFLYVSVVRCPCCVHIDISTVPNQRQVSNV